MPKSPSVPPSSRTTKAVADDAPPSLRMSDVALRKKKNADAQAAFRARRANYIATLEETVTSLESVVLQLQESCREARNETHDLRQENNRLRHDGREREKFWKSLLQAKKNTQGGGNIDADDMSISPSFGPAHTCTMNGPLGSAHMQHYDNLSYRPADDSSICPPAYNVPPGSAHPYLNHSPAMAYTSGGEGDDNLGSRLSKYSTYNYAVQARDTRWQNTSVSSNEPLMTGANASAAQLSVLDSAPYSFPGAERFAPSAANSRSLSPTSTPGSSSSTHLTSSYQFSFPEHNVTPHGVGVASGIATTAPPDRADFDFRRHSISHSGEVTLHGGTADLSAAALACADGGVRYRIGAGAGARRLDVGGAMEHSSLLPVLPPLSGSDNGSANGGRIGEDAEGGTMPYGQVRPRRDTMPPRSSRSPSPNTSHISCTVAVIKAQAFGALRRTRARTKKSSEGAARVAMDVLEARGLGMAAPISNKRARLDTDDVELQ